MRYRVEHSKRNSIPPRAPCILFTIAFLLIFISENLLQFPTTSSCKQEIEGNALEIGFRSVSEACKCLLYSPKVGGERS